MRNEIWALTSYLGAPSWYITLSPADIEHPVALYYADTKETFEPNLFRTKDNRLRMIADNPVAGCPDTVAEDAIAICHATSMGCATFLRGVLYYEAKLIEDHTQCVTDVRSKGLINCIWIFHSVSCHWCVNPAWRYAVNTAFRRNLHDLVLQR